MLEVVGVVQILALIIVLPIIFGLVGFFHSLSKNLWPYFYLIFLLVASSILTWQATFEVKWLSTAVFAAVICMSVVGLKNLLIGTCKFFQTNFRSSASELKGFSRIGFFLISVCLIIEVFFAAFPGYRYDQYNYHLVTPKLISMYGKLPPFIASECTHFTGAWEYFFTIFRTFLSHDLLIQTCTTTFTFLSYVVPSSAFLWRISNPQKWRALWCVGIPALLIYAHTELEPIISAKPDFVILALALAVVCAQRLTLGYRLFFSCFFLLVGISLKVTWLHAGVALAVGVSLSLWRDRLRFSPQQWMSSGVLPGLGGVLIAVVCLWPVFYKNIVFFGNPIHPTQLGPLTSKVTTPEFFKFWEGISQRPSGFGPTIINMARVFPYNVGLLFPILPLIALCTWFSFKALKQQSRHASRRAIAVVSYHFPWLCSWLAYVLVWGVIFRFDIYNRFVAVGMLFPLLFIVYFSRFFSSAAVLAGALLTPVALNGALEVKLRRMLTGALQSYDAYSRDNFSPSLQDYREAKIIHAHAREQFGENWRDSCHIFTNKPNHYFFNTRSVVFDDFSLEYHINTFGRELYNKCPWAYFKSIKACYLIATHELEFVQWPFPMSDLAKLAKVNLATSTNSDLRLLFVSPEAIDDKIKSTPECVEALYPNRILPEREISL